MSESSVVRLSVSLPSSLVNEFNRVWRNMEYTNRSKAVHDAIRNFISDYNWMGDGAEQVMGAIVLLYYLNRPGLLNKIMKVQHEYENMISSTMHIHLTKDKCLEIIAVKGASKDLRNLAQRLTAHKGVKQLKLAAVVP